jgi:hypothetical protein
MAKRNRENRPDKYEKWIKEGYGQGIGMDYKPWLTIQDVPSKGRVTRLHGIKIDRQHDVFWIRKEIIFIFWSLLIV